MDKPVRWTRSARRHKIGRAHVMVVMNGSDPEVIVNDQGQAELHWVGADDRGLVLEIVALDYPDSVLVLHVMPASFRRRNR